MPSTRAVKSVGRANLLKNIQATLESSQDVIDDGPLNSSNQSAGPSKTSKRVTTIAELLQSQNRESRDSSDDSDEDDFFVPSATQMALGVTQTPTDQVPTDASVLCVEPAESQATDIPDSQTVNPPNCTPASRIAEFDQTEETIDDPLEVHDSSDFDSASDGETENPQFLFLESQNAENSATKEVESTEIPVNMFTGLPSKNTSENNESRRLVFNESLSLVIEPKALI